ncbi:MAG: YybH family protein [bacterium]
MGRFIAILMVFFGGVLLTTVAAADDVDDIKKATLEHLATLNAGDAAGHVQHHLPVYSGFDAGGGLLESYDSLEDQKNNLKALFDSGVKVNFQLRHLEVKVYGNAAIVTGYMVGTVTSPDGTIQQVTNRRTAVLIKQAGQWREVHLHTSPLITAPSQ